MHRAVLFGLLGIAIAVSGCGGSSGGAGTGGSGGATGKAGSGGGAGASGNAGAGAGGGGQAGGGGAGAGGGQAGGGGAGAGGGQAGGGGAGAGGGQAGGGGAGGALAACGDATGSSNDVCSTITGSATGPCVATAMSAATAPTAAGGPVSNGTYQFTASTFYGTLPDAAGSTDGDLQTRRETFVVSNATSSSFTLQQFQASGTQTSSEEGTVAISGTMVSYTPTCPPPADGGNNGGSAGFTANSTSFTLILSKNGGTLIRVYTKQS